MVSLQFIARHKLAKKVPLGGMISFSKLAEYTGTSELTLQRLLRQAMMLRVFCEPEPGMVGHTAASKLLVNPNFNDWLSMMGHLLWYSATKFGDALQKWPGSEEPEETGFALGHNTKMSFYDYTNADEARAESFAGAMEAYSSCSEFNVSHMVDGYDWDALGEVKVVDIGGAQGHIAVELAKRFPTLDIVVQDLPRMVENATASVPEKLKERVQFMGYDFFEPQTVEADVYYYRWVFHNWSDKYAIRILKALAPALKPGAKVLIMDAVMPELGVLPHWRERFMRYVKSITILLFCPCIRNSS